MIPNSLPRNTGSNEILKTGVISQIYLYLSPNRAEGGGG